MGWSDRGAGEAINNPRHAMTRSPPPRPSKEELGEMTVAQLNAYIGDLRRELEWARGFRHKAVLKRIEVAEQVCELRRGREEKGDV
jgi:hypothetical protein